MSGEAFAITERLPKLSSGAVPRGVRNGARDR